MANAEAKGVFTIITLKDIANACGVSVSTASRAFDQSSRISQPVRQKILSCASEMGYTPNLIARSLKSNQTMTVALIVPSIDNRFYIDVLKYIEIALHQRGYRLLVSFIQNGITTELECLETMVAAKVDAIILIPLGNDSNRRYIESLQDKVKIIQLFSAPFHQIDSVIMDDETGTELGTNYLLQHNHHRIILAGGEERINGFWRAIDTAGISRHNVLTLPGNASSDQIRQAITTFHPSAVFSIANVSESVWIAVQDLGLSVPNDISLIFYDNPKWVSLVGITAIAHNYEAIASALVSQLLHRLRQSEDSPPCHIVLQPFVVERSSVKMLPPNTANASACFPSR